MFNCSCGGMSSATIAAFNLACRVLCSGGSLLKIQCANVLSADQHQSCCWQEQVPAILSAAVVAYRRSHCLLPLLGRQYVSA